MSKKSCVFCIRAPEGLLPFRNVDCGRPEFFHGEYLKQKEIDDSLGDRIYYEA